MVPLNVAAVLDVCLRLVGVANALLDTSHAIRAPYPTTGEQDQDRNNMNSKEFRQHCYMHDNIQVHVSWQTINVEHGCLALYSYYGDISSS